MVENRHQLLHHPRQYEGSRRPLFHCNEGTVSIRKSQIGNGQLAAVV